MPITYDVIVKSGLPYRLANSSGDTCLECTDNMAEAISCRRDAIHGVRTLTHTQQQMDVIGHNGMYDDLYIFIVIRDGVDMGFNDLAPFV